MQIVWKKKHRCRDGTDLDVIFDSAPSVYVESIDTMMGGTIWHA